MTDDQVFRYVLMAGFILVFPIGIYHRIKSRTGEKLDRLQEGFVILVSLRLMGLVGIAGQCECDCGGELREENEGQRNGTRSHLPGVFHFPVLQFSVGQIVFSIGNRSLLKEGE